MYHQKKFTPDADANGENPSTHEPSGVIRLMFPSGTMIP